MLYGGDVTTVFIVLSGICWSSWRASPHFIKSVSTLFSLYRRGLSGQSVYIPWFLTLVSHPSTPFSLRVLRIFASSRSRFLRPTKSNACDPLIVIA